MPLVRKAALKGFSLRAKGAFAFSALAVYLLVIAAIVEGQRLQLSTMVEELERIHSEEEAVHRVNFSLAQAILTANERYYAEPAGRDFFGVLVSAETVQTGLASLAHHHPEVAPLTAEIGERIAALVSSGERAGVLDLRESLHRVAAAMDVVTTRVRERKKTLSEGYRSQYDAISLVWIGMGVIGILAVGVFLFVFFTRVASDLRKLQERALGVVNGYRGPGLTVERADEIGALMHSVNRMQEDLRAHETRVELARQQQFHREKMAAVGGLAAQIAHEINNPIAAIAGVAQAIEDERSSERCLSHGAACQPRLILEQTKRISVITRQIADFSTPRPAERQLLDLNALIESTCAFVGYDQRFRALALQLELDRQLPAVTAVGDHLAQVLMNLLINAADAIAEARVAGRVSVATRQAAGKALITVSDNGKGMDDAIKRRAFEEFFTTKPQGRGSGLGLALCRHLVRAQGGEIELESRPGEGTLVTVSLPLGEAFGEATA